MQDVAAQLAQPPSSPLPPAPTSDSGVWIAILSGIAVALVTHTLERWAAHQQRRAERRDARDRELESLYADFSVSGAEYMFATAERTQLIGKKQPDDTVLLAELHRDFRELSDRQTSNHTRFVVSFRRLMAIETRQDYLDYLRDLYGRVQQVRGPIGEVQDFQGFAANAYFLRGELLKFLERQSPLPEQERAVPRPRPTATAPA